MRQTHKFSQLALALASALLCGAAQAENITYPGAALQSTMLVGTSPHQNVLAPTTGTAANNTVTVGSLGTSVAPWNIFGGWHGTEKVSKNTVIVKEAVLDGTFIAGGMGVGETSYNTVDISSKSRSATPDTVVVYGSYSQSGSSDWNTVSVTNRNVTSFVMGGYSHLADNASSSNNSVVLDNSESMYVYGGQNNNMDLAKKVDTAYF